MSATGPVTDDTMADGGPVVGPPEERKPARDRLASRQPDTRKTPGWAETLVRILDDGVRVPGTEFRFGADAIIGFFLPGVGDVATGTGSVSLLVLALKERVPTVVVGRMVWNIAIDTLVGSLPIAGDAFDLFWKSNRKNLDLIEQYRNDPHAKPTAADYLLVGLGVLFAALSVVLPLVVVWLIAGAIAASVAGSGQ